METLEMTISQLKSKMRYQIRKYYKMLNHLREVNDRLTIREKYDLILELNGIGSKVGELRKAIK